MATASVPATAYINRHPLLRSPAFAAYRGLMTRTLRSVGDTAASAVEQVIPPLASAVRVAVETVAANTAAEIRGIERSWSHQLDSGVAALKQHTSDRVEEVAVRSVAAAEDLKAHIDARFNRLEAELRRKRALLARLLTDDVVQDPRGRALVREELERELTPAAPGSAVAQVLRGASEVAVSAARPPPPPPRRVCERLTADRDSARALHAAGKLASVPVFESEDEYVPLLPMSPGLSLC